MANTNGIADDGQGATLTLGTSAWDTNALITSIEFDSITREALQTSHLGTTGYHTYVPADLKSPGTVSVEFFADSGAAADCPPMSAAETVTVTYPIPAGGLAGATVAFSGFCIDYKPRNAAMGELMKGSAKWQITGAITFTQSTSS